MHAEVCFLCDFWHFSINITVVPGNTIVGYLGIYFLVDWVVWCRGHKIFWLVPPTDKNLLLYEQWVKEQTDRTEFFGDLAEGCCRIEILAGQQLRVMY